MEKTYLTYLIHFCVDLSYRESVCDIAYQKTEEGAK